MAIILDWKIRATEARCELSGEEFVDEQDFYTCIFADPESDGFLRRDYSVESWNKIRNEIEPAPFSFWRSTYKAPVVESDDDGLADTSIEGMLRRFIEEDDSKTEHARYILALMLERKKTLIPTDSKETETRKLLFYEHVETGDVFIVADPQLKLDEIEAVQAEVAELLAEEERRRHAPETSAEGVGDDIEEETGEPTSEVGEAEEPSETAEQSLEESTEKQADHTEESGEETAQSE